MNIVINVNKYYDWDPTTDTPSEEAILKMQYKQSADGSWLKKVEKVADSHTFVSLPEAEITDCQAHFERVGQPKTAEQVVGWYLEEKVMPHHSLPENWVSIECDDAKLQTYLNNRFGLTTKASAGKE